MNPFNQPAISWKLVTHAVRPWHFKLILYLNYSFEFLLCLFKTITRSPMQETHVTVDCNPESIIPPRDCKVRTNDRLAACEEISSWVREHGIKLEEAAIDDASRRLLMHWDDRPDNCTAVIFRKGAKVVSYEYEYL